MAPRAPGTQFAGIEDNALQTNTSYLNEHIFDKPISPDAIRSAADAILLCQEEVDKFASTPKSTDTPRVAKAKSMVELKLLEAKLLDLFDPRKLDDPDKVEGLGSRVPALKAMCAGLISLKRPGTNMTPKHLAILVEQAWPEITRLRLEREARLQKEKLMDAALSCLTGVKTKEELTVNLSDANKMAHQMDREGKILQAIQRLGALVPIFLAEEKDVYEKEDVPDESEDTMQPMKPTRKGGVTHEAQLLANAIDPYGEILNMDGKKKSHSGNVVTPVWSPELSPAEKRQKVHRALVKAAEDTAHLLNGIHSHSDAYDFQHDAALLDSTVSDIKKIVGDVNEDTTAAQLEKFNPYYAEELEALISANAPVMMKMHAQHQNVSGAQMEKLLKGCSIVASKKSPPAYLAAVLNQVTPQIERIREKETEVEKVLGALEQLQYITERDDFDDEKKISKLRKFFQKRESDIKDRLRGHRQRYHAWLKDSPDISPEFFNNSTPESGSDELKDLADIVAACETAVQHNDTANIGRVVEQAKRLYRPTAIKKRDPEMFMAALTSIEEFRHAETDRPNDGSVDDETWEEEKEKRKQDLTEKIGQITPILKRLKENPRVNLARLAPVFEEIDYIMSSEDPSDFLMNGDGATTPEKLDDMINDAWAGVNQLKIDQNANKKAQQAAQFLDAVASEDRDMDELKGNTENLRVDLDALIDKDKNQFKELALLDALSDLTKVDDRCAIFAAKREAESQMGDIKAAQNQTVALKKLHKGFATYIAALNDNPGGGPESEAALEEPKNELKELVKSTAKVVVHLASLEQQPDALRDTLSMATMLTHPEYAKRLDFANPSKILPSVMSTVVAPEIMQHTSTPAAEEIEDLIDDVEEIMETEVQAHESIAESTQKLKRKQAISQKIAKKANDHRRRIGYRSRMMAAKAADEPIQLREAEPTGAEWDGFRVEDVILSSAVEDEVDACQKAFDSFDINNDKFITINEVCDFLLTVPPEERPKGLADVNPYQKRKMATRIRKLDKDGDGLLSYEEFKAWWESDPERSNNTLN